MVVSIVPCNRDARIMRGHRQIYVVIATAEVPMLTPALIQSHSEVGAPALTVYLDANLRKQTYRRLKPNYLTRLESQGKLITPTVSPSHAEAFREQVARVEAYLRSEPLRCKGIVILAGRDVWEPVPLQLGVEDELRRGALALTQLYWMLDEHRPYGVVVAGQKRTQFFLYWLEEMLEQEGKESRLEISKAKEMGHVARSGGVRVSRGKNREVFEHHVAAVCARYHRQIAERMERSCAEEHLDSVFLVSSSEIAKGIWKELPEFLREKLFSIDKDLSRVFRAELKRRLRPIVVGHERKRDVALVDALLGDSRGAVVGIDETLARLQQGTTRNVVVAKGLGTSLRTPSRCASSCLSWRDATTFPQTLCLGRLQETGGMGAWPSQFERKEYGQQLTFA